MMERLDDTFAEKVSKHGKALITNLSILIKLTGIYASVNEAITNVANRVLQEFKPLVGNDEELSIKMASESFFIEDVRIKATVADVDNFSFLIKILNERGIGILTFHSSLQAPDLIDTAYTIKKSHEASEIQSHLESKFKKSISIDGPVYAQKEGGIDLKDTQLVARRSYVKAIAALMDTDNSIKTGKALSVKKAKRAIQSLVDCTLKDESYVLGLTTVRNSENYHYNHCVNVALLSVALGKRIGLGKYQLGLLGMAALFHDIGKTEIPLSILNKTSELSPKETALLRMHPVDGVKQLLRTRGFTDVSILSVLVCFEHHMNLDHSGYPQTSKNRTPNIFSRIVRIADAYDSLVSGKVYSRSPLGTKETLTAMHEKSGVYYDPVLMKTFIGIFQSDQ